jgi:DNA repair protein SbcD/Mre11
LPTIVELRIEGEVRFDRLELDTRTLQQTLQARSNALIFLLKYEVTAAEYASPLSEEANRQQIEREIFTDLLTANAVYQKRSEPLAQGLIDLKDRQLEGVTDEALYALVEQLLD